MSVLVDRFSFRMHIMVGWMSRYKLEEMESTFVDNIHYMNPFEPHFYMPHHEKICLWSFRPGPHKPGCTTEPQKMAS